VQAARLWYRLLPHDYYRQRNNYPLYYLFRVALSVL
jgi:hypothetical protein